MRGRIALIALVLVALAGGGIWLATRGGDDKEPGHAVSYGISGEEPKTFADPRFAALGLRQARVQASWDILVDAHTAENPDLASERERLARWFTAARKAGVTDVLLAIKSSRAAPAKLPERAAYADGVRRLTAWLDERGFGAMVKAISPWNEPNIAVSTRTNPAAAGALYRVVSELCRTRHCTPVAGEFTDHGMTRPYLSAYRAAAGGPAPRVWAWHAYEDAWDRASDPSLPRLRRFAAALPADAQIWLTEQGGIVRRLRPGDDGRVEQSPHRAAGDLAFLMRATARLDPRITRFDVYQFKGEAAPRWDSGLIAPDGSTRESYEVYRKCIPMPYTCTL